MLTAGGVQGRFTSGEVILGSGSSTGSGGTSFGLSTDSDLTSPGEVTTPIRSVRQVVSGGRAISQGEFAVLEARFIRVSIPGQSDSRMFFKGRSDGLTVMYEVIRLSDSQDWFHLAISRKSRLPSTEDILLVRRCFYPADAKVFQSFPDDGAAINVVHLFSSHFIRVPEEIFKQSKKV